jgi:LL-diaminopimelate aminotransferase
VELPKAAMYLWVALPSGVSSKVFARHALESEGVLVLPGSAFGPAGEGFFRIALTVPSARLVEAVGRLSNALAGVQEAGGVRSA